MRIKNTPRLVAVTCVTVGLAACGGVPFPQAMNGPEASLTPFQAYPISVAERVVSVEIDTPATSFTITRDASDRVKRLANAYLELGEGTINILTPTGTNNAASAIGAAAEISNAMNEVGVDYRSIRVMAYRGDGENMAPPVIVSFNRFTATTPGCGNFTGSFSQTYNNTPTPNFGCAYQANVAAMIANPKDLIEPRAEQPGDIARRTKVLDQYREGEITNTKVRTDEETVKASDVFE
ncbi:MAG: CpaD family pilus assembly protein [Pseudomonadota bacterium]